MKGAYQWWNEREKDCGVDIKLESELSGDNLRYLMRLVAREHRKPDKWVDVCAATCLWPDPEGRTLAGAVMNLTVVLDRLLDDWMLDRTGLATSAR